MHFQALSNSISTMREKESMTIPKTEKQDDYFKQMIETFFTFSRIFFLHLQHLTSHYQTVINLI